MLFFASLANSLASTISGMPSPSVSSAAQLIMRAEAADDDVPLPGRILEPDQLRHAAGERDQVGLAVMIQVRDHHLVAAAKSGGDGVFGESRGRRGGRVAEGPAAARRRRGTLHSILVDYAL